ncbi:MAG TPA: SCP2 sterol-binding domain-containing protein [Caulobacteraceae bacterium]|nr:SCP2 sterol-binding domain-containing protein [Caulobacteraceae bacterium]
MASLETITQTLQRALDGQAGLDKTLKIDLRGEGFLFIEGAVVSNDDRPADCTVSVSKNDLEDLARGRLDPMAALMRGRMRVNGDMSVAMRLAPLLAASRR